jgi:hypothetical protein
MNQEFAPVLKREMHDCAGGGGGGDRMLSRVKNDLEEVKGVVHESLSKVLERDEQLNTLVVQTDSLMDTSRAFKNNANTLKVSWLVVSFLNNTWWMQ